MVGSDQGLSLRAKEANMRTLIAGTIAAAAVITAASAQEIAPETKGYSISVSYSDFLSRNLDRINRVEQIREERFREDRFDERSFREAGTQRFAESKTAGTVWAGETLIPDLDNFTATNLLKAMTAVNVNRAAPDFSGEIRIYLESLKVDDHSVAVMQAASSWAMGTIALHHSGGEVDGPYDVTANLVVDPTVDRSYEGPKFAFAETDENTRVGPTLAYFVEQALEKAWPERSQGIHGPVIVRISEPNERLINSRF